MSAIDDELPGYICVDVETSGPIPAGFSLLSIGACTLSEPRQTFYVTLQPDRSGVEPQAMEINKLDLAELARAGAAPLQAMQQFEAWIGQVVPGGQRPIFVALNAPFDWMFVHDYFIRYLGRDPFGHSALDIKAVFMGTSRLPWCSANSNELHQRYYQGVPLTHNALQDAIDQAIIFEHILRENFDFD